MNRQDELEKIGPLFGEIGATASEIVGGNPDGIYLYAEVEDGSVFASLYRDEGAVVRYFDPNDALFGLILEAWKAEPSDKRWLVLEFEVHGRQFNAHLTFPEEVDLKEFVGDRRDAAVDKRYGHKPVLYPPVPDDFEELK